MPSPLASTVSMRSRLDETPFVEAVDTPSTLVRPAAEGRFGLGSAAMAVAALGAGGSAARRRRSHNNGGRWSGVALSALDPYERDEKEEDEGGKNLNPLQWIQMQFSKMPIENQEDIKTFFVSLSVALCIRWTVIEPRYIPSLSMFPTFEVGDQLTVDKVSRNWRDFQRRDVVVFNPPPAFNEYVGSDRSGEALIKRIVAIEGDSVQIKDGGKLYINGEPQTEDFTNQAASYNFGPVQVPPGCVFVLGDNRNASLDGHVWGFLPKENIIGRATLKFWPPWRVGGIQASPE